MGGSLSLGEIQAKMVILSKVHLVWFILAAFPGAMLVFDQKSCVSFQGVDPVVDFFGAQIFGYSLLMPWLCTAIIARPGYAIYHGLVAFILAIVQISAFFIHTIGLANHGEGLTEFTDCFGVDFGGVYYIVVANLGGFLLAMCNFVIAIHMYTKTTGKKCCCIGDGGGFPGQRKVPVSSNSDRNQGGNVPMTAAI